MSFYGVTVGCWWEWNAGQTELLFWSDMVTHALNRKDDLCPSLPRPQENMQKDYLSLKELSLYKNCLNLIELKWEGIARHDRGVSQGSSGRVQAEPCAKAVSWGKEEGSEAPQKGCQDEVFSVFFLSFSHSSSVLPSFFQGSLLSEPVFKCPANCQCSGLSHHDMEAALVSEACMSSTWCTDSPCRPNISPACVSSVACAAHDHRRASRADYSRDGMRHCAGVMQSLILQGMAEPRSSCFLSLELSWSEGGYDKSCL